MVGGRAELSNEKYFIAALLAESLNNLRISVYFSVYTASYVLLVQFLHEAFHHFFFFSIAAWTMPYAILPSYSLLPIPHRNSKVHYD